MSILKSLKLSAVTPVRAGASEFAFRDKLLRYLDEQKALAEAEIGGTAFQATKRVTRTNDAGEKVRVEAPRTVRKGYGRFFPQDKAALAANILNQVWLAA